ncbi:hypothetical protein NL676_007606 [Syzygium grande]|nr:hypothetical protein NL676_007606 [Syzygium grande]
MRLLILAAAAVLLLLQVSAMGPPIHNDKAKTGLVLEKVVRGETQVMSGTNYRLVIQVKDGAETKSYEAIVFDKPWDYVRRLTSFKPLLGNA